MMSVWAFGDNIIAVKGKQSFQMILKKRKDKKAARQNLNHPT